MLLDDRGQRRRAIEHRLLVCRDLGSGWAASGRSAALRMPSAVVDGDWNVLLNPRHADFSKIQVAALKPFRFDGRMFR